MDEEKLESDSPLNRSLSAAIENPADFDFGFEAEREASGFANFGVDPAKAQALRDEENQKAGEA